MMGHKHSLAAKYSSKWKPLKMLLSRLVSGEAECLLAIGEDSRCKLFRVTSLRSVTFKKWEGEGASVLSFSTIGYFQVSFASVSKQESSYNACLLHGNEFVDKLYCGLFIFIFHLTLILTQKATRKWRVTVILISICYFFCSYFFTLIFLTKILHPC